MINPSELRIGNLFSYNGMTMSVKELIEGMGEHKRVVTVNHLFPKAIDPIALTEEWLLKFGFAQDESDVPNGVLDEMKDFSIQELRKKMILRLDEKRWYVYFVAEGWSDYVEIREIDFVHELQNLFHSMMEKELSFNK